MTQNGRDIKVYSEFCDGIVACVSKQLTRRRGMLAHERPRFQ